MVTIDCADPQGLAEFWTKALDVEIRGDYGDFVMLGGAERLSGLHLGLQRVPQPTPGKNRVHVDLMTDDLQAEVDRLVELGASRLEDHEMPYLRWVVLEDPEGTVFCVGQPSQSETPG
jgi:predicted enzyme related to lactoylglutathione lyase